MGKQVDKVRSEYTQLQEKLKKSSLDPESVQSEISEEELEQKLASLNSLKSQQKELYFLLIERFVYKLGAHLNPINIKQEDGVKMCGESPHFFKWASERFEDILLTHNEEILPYLEEIKAQVLTASTHKSIMRIFKMYSTFKK